MVHAEIVTVISADGMRATMADELELCTAAFFRTIGKDVATTDEFVMEVSLGQKWMTPSEAKALLSALIRSGKIEQKDGYIRPKGDIAQIDVPLAYRPSKDVLQHETPKQAPPVPKTSDGKSQDVFPELMEIAVGAGIPRREFIQECNRIQKNLDIDICVAALVVLRDAGVDIAPLTGKVRDWVAGPVTPS